MAILSIPLQVLLLIRGGMSPTGELQVRFERVISLSLQRHLLRRGHTFQVQVDLTSLPRLFGGKGLSAVPPELLQAQPQLVEAAGGRPPVYFPWSRVPLATVAPFLVVVGALFIALDCLYEDPNAGTDNKWFNTTRPSGPYIPRFGKYTPPWEVEYLIPLATFPQEGVVQRIAARTSRAEADVFYDLCHYQARHRQVCQYASQCTLGLYVFISVGHIIYPLVTEVATLVGQQHGLAAGVLILIITTTFNRQAMQMTRALIKKGIQAVRVTVFLVSLAVTKTRAALYKGSNTGHTDEGVVEGTNGSGVNGPW